MTKHELKDFLDRKADQYNTTAFIADDPISLPHRFDGKEDKEIIAFIVATISWGNRKSILTNGDRLIQLINGTPHTYVMEYKAGQLIDSGFVHRTFNAVDLDYFIQALQYIYKEHGGLEFAFAKAYKQHHDLQRAITDVRSLFLSLPSFTARTKKHFSDPSRGSSAKRINMFLRWMLRRDDRGVDFGLWEGIPMSALSLPLDVHTGNIARQLGLLTRKQNDQKAVQELDAALRMLDPVDPVRYDYALFGIGVNKDLELPTSA